MPSGSSKRRKRRERRAAATEGHGGGEADLGGCGKLRDAKAAEAAARTYLREEFRRDSEPPPTHWLTDGHPFFEGAFDEHWSRRTVAAQPSA